MPCNMPKHPGHGSCSRCALACTAELALHFVVQYKFLVIITILLLYYNCLLCILWCNINFSLLLLLLLLLYYNSWTSFANKYNFHPKFMGFLHINYVHCTINHGAFYSDVKYGIKSHFWSR